MKKLFPFIFCLSAITILISCNGSQPEHPIVYVPSDTVKLTSKDVKGIIVSGNKVTMGDYTYITTDPKDPSKTISYEGVTVRFSDKLNLSIVPTTLNFDSLKAGVIESLKTWGTYDSISGTANSFIYHSSSEFAGTKTEGYNFIVLIKGKTKQYEIKGEGADPLKPIADKQDADKAYKAALSFTPAE